jgi:sugar O-acyltransferase (sialic acid O-acetyltransferase NeuD family)
MKLVVVGAGGHARAVLDAVRAGKEHEAVCLTDPRQDLAGGEVEGVSVVGDDSFLPKLLQKGVTGACIGVGGTGDNSLRSSLFKHVAELGFELPPIVHPAATVAASSRIGAGSVVLAAAVVGPGARLAENVAVNTGAVVEHDCVLEAHVHLATGALLGGGVVVGDFAHIGIGACVLQDLRIGTKAIVGAGSVVIRDVAPLSTVAGCPAVPLEAKR